MSLIKIVAAFFLLAPSTFATSFIDRPFPTTVSEAPVIVKGRIGKSESKWSQGPDGSRKIFTYTELMVTEVLKSPHGIAEDSAIQLRELGGEIDGVGMVVPGTAKFEKDEDVVVLLSEENSDRSYDLRGLMIGKLKVEKASDGQEVLSGPAISGTGPRNLLSQPDEESTPGGNQRWTLDALKKLISEQSKRPADSPLSVTPSPSASFGSGSGFSGDSASQLQNREGVESSSERAVPSQAEDSFWGSRWIAGLGIVILSGVLFMLWRRMSKK
jgi:hypothetical protein